MVDPKKKLTFLKKETNGFDKEKSQIKPNNNVNENVKEDVSDSCVNGLQRIIDFYNNNIGMLSPYGLEVLSDYSKEMQDDLVILAMKKAVEANIRTIKYIKGILNNWSKKGIKTVIEAENEDEHFRTKSNPEETEEEKIARKLKELEGE